MKEVKDKNTYNYCSLILIILILWSGKKPKGLQEVVKLKPPMSQSIKELTEVDVDFLLL